MCIGDKLIGYQGAHTITRLRFVPQRLNIFSITVEPTHTYYIGEHKILTHNMPLLFYFGISFAFGSGTIEGAAAGSFFGPVGMTVGMMLGGLLGIAVKKCMNHYAVPSYDDISFDVTFLERTFFEKEAKQKNPPESKPKQNMQAPAPQYDSGAQAPGKPTE